MKKSKVLAMALVSSSVVWGSSAFAGGTLGGGQIVLSADRLFGLSFSSISTEPGTGGGKTTDSRTSIALLWPPLTAVSYSPYQIPHASLDFIVPGGLSVGGSLGFISGSGTRKTEAANGGASVERDDPSITILTFAPRVGYALGLAPSIVFWPRGGITFYSIKQDSTTTLGMQSVTTKNTISGLGLNLEANVVLMVAEHFGIIGGPVLDIPLSGTSSTEVTPQTGPAPADDKVKFTNYGLAIGLLGAF
jgi:hypothetical protein